jgi:hypothetical protein
MLPLSRFSGGNDCTSDNQVCLIAVYGQPVDFAPLVTNKKMTCRWHTGWQRCCDRVITNHCVIFKSAARLKHLATKPHQHKTQYQCWQHDTLNMPHNTRRIPQNNTTP